VFLAGPVFFVSGINAVVGLSVVLISPILFLFSICHPGKTFRQILMSLLAPLLRWQLEWIYAAVPHASESVKSLSSLPESRRQSQIHQSNERNSPIYVHQNANFRPRRDGPIDDYDDASYVTPNSLSLPMLLFIHLLSPLISVGVVISTWVSAFFWFYASIIGDPNGTQAEEQRTNRRYFYGDRVEENDGRASVLAVRAWWKSWLKKACENEEDDLLFLDD
jgi:hypothetical protein